MPSRNTPPITVELAEGVQLSGETLANAVRNAIEFSIIGMQMLAQAEQREIKANILNRTTLTERSMMSEKVIDIMSYLKATLTYVDGFTSGSYGKSSHLL